MIDRVRMATYKRLIRVGQVCGAIVILAGLLIMLSPFLFMGHPFRLDGPTLMWEGGAVVLLVLSEFILRYTERRMNEASPPTQNG